ncbi:DHH family phosphoesterase, partial [bacterium]|nr:DHH family phosphoesterase [bacterium]
MLKNNDLFSAPSQIIELLRNSESFLILTHVRPDGDAIGSVAGLSKSLRKAGKKVDIGVSGLLPERFSFLLSEELILKPGLEKVPHDSVFLLDCGELSRSGFEQDLLNYPGKIVNIDHHASNVGFGQYNFLDFESSSTCEMLVSLITGANFPLDAEVAEGLYLGLMTDSRFFQNEGLRPSAFHAAAVLLSTGLNTSRLLSILNQNRSLSELKVLARGLHKLQCTSDGRFANLILTYEEILEMGGKFEE